MAAKRTRQPVRRHSRAKGREGMFWRPITRQEVGSIVKAAETFDRARKEFGRRNGPLGHVALEVLRYFGNLVDFKSGRLDPSIGRMMMRLRRSKQAIVDALKALRRHGFLDWIRRYVPTGNDGRGPQVQQTSNAYRLLLPAAALRCLGLRASQPPIPADVLQAKAERAAADREHRAALSLGELPLFVMGAGDRLGEALARLGRIVEERGSADREEPRPDFGQGCRKAT